MSSSKACSIVEYYAEHEGYKCGYCKSPNTNFSHGLWAHSMTVEDYQSLIDRGWRRSGSYCYKPTMHQTCCPMYTIKCKALDFRLSRSQRKILKQVARFLKNDSKIENDKKDKTTKILGGKSTEAFICPPKFQSLQDQNSKIEIEDVEIEESGKSEILTKPKMIKNKDNHAPSASNQVKKENKVVSMDTDEKPFKKARLLRIERKKNKLLGQGKTLKEIEAMFEENRRKNSGKTIEEYFNEICSDSSRLQNKIVKVKSEEFLSTLNESSSLYKKYQMAIHEEPASKCDTKTFFNFLVKSPLQESSGEKMPTGYGSFHDQYWLDGKLIAVAVIDILPSCVSSVYFFYDPAFSSLSLGTFSSLREIYLTRKLNQVASNLEYYYMGFYIHTCPKMRYKARMKPSQLLCPETYAWCDIDQCLPKLDKEKYCRLNEDMDAVDENGFVDVQQVLILYGRRTMPYKFYRERSSAEDQNAVKEYASFVGKQCSQRMLLYRG